jgi:NADPH:quinone reductase-like Zn-dependent oxidoreductase
VILNYTTAYQLLNRAARLKSGDRALIHGAAGGVGTAMLQLAQLQGIKLYGTVSGGKMSLVRAD